MREYLEPIQITRICREVSTRWVNTNGGIHGSMDLRLSCADCLFQCGQIPPALVCESKGMKGEHLYHRDDTPVSHANMVINNLPARSTDTDGQTRGWSYQRWSYQHFQPGSPDAVLSLLKSKGQEGWELISVQSGDFCFRKRAAE